VLVPGVLVLGVLVPGVLVLGLLVLGLLVLGVLVLGVLLLGLLEGGDLVEREQPHRRRVDRHRRVHGGERDAVEQRAHVADVADRDADLADLAAGELVVGVVAGLGGQVEGDREAGLAL